MKKVIAIFFILTCTTTSAQMYINKNKQKVRRHLEEQIQKTDSLAISISETDTSLVYSIRDPKVLPADFLYFFDASGKCIEERTIGFCDSCFRKFLGTALRRKEFQWTKLTDNLYISKYSKKLMLEIPLNNQEHSFTVRRMKWTRPAYSTLLKMK